MMDLSVINNHKTILAKANHHVLQNNLLFESFHVEYQLMNSLVSKHQSNFVNSLSHLAIVVQSNVSMFSVSRIL